MPRAASRDRDEQEAKASGRLDSGASAPGSSRILPSSRVRADAQQQLEARLGKRRARALVKTLQEAADLLREP